MRTSEGTAALTRARSPFLKRFLLGSLWLAIAALVGSALLTQTQAGRDLISERLVRALSDAIPGTVFIGRLAAIDADGIRVHGLTFTAPNDEEVLKLDRVTLHPDWLGLLSGRLQTSSVRVEGGTLVIHELPDGSLPLEDAFSGEGPPNSEPGPVVALHNIAAENLLLVLDLDALEQMKVEQLNALVRIDLSAAGDLEVNFARAEGTLLNHPLGDRAQVRETSGRVRGSAEQVLAMTATLDVEGETFELAVDYFNRDETPVVIRASDVSASWVGVRMKAAAAASNLVSAVDLQINPEED